MEWMPWGAATAPALLALVFLRGTAVVAGAGLLASMLRKASAATRHVVWSLAFAALLFLPYLTVASPELSVELPVPAWADAGTVRSVPMARSGPGFPASAAEREARPEGAHRTVDGAAEPGDPESAALASADARAVGSEAATVAAAAPGGIPTNGRVLWVLTAVWIAGVLVMLGRLLAGLWQVTAITRRARPLAREAMGVGSAEASRVRFYVSPEISVPMTWGLFRPVVLLPREALDWSADRMRYVILHELAHIRGGHYLHHLLAEIALVLYWVNPLVWLAARRAREDLERACDDGVLRSGVGAKAYARELVAMARQTRGARLAGAVGLYAARSSLLGKRVRAILSPSLDRGGSSTEAVVASLVAVGFLLLGAAAISFRSSDGPLRAQQEVAGFLQELASADTKTAMRAAWALGDREDPAAVEALVGTLDSGDPRVRGMAAWALGEIKDRRALGSLVGHLDDPDARAREMMVMAVGELETRSSVESVVALLDDGVPAVRAAAAWALGEIRGPDATDALMGALVNDDDAVVREAAALALRQARGSGTVDALVDALVDPVMEVRLAAVEALAHRAIEPPADEGAFRALLVMVGSDSHPKVRQISALALGTKRDSRAVDALLDALGDSDQGVRAAAVWALDELEGPSKNTR